MRETRTREFFGGTREPPLFPGVFPTSFSTVSLRNRVCATASFQQAGFGGFYPAAGECVTVRNGRGRKQVEQHEEQPKA